MTVYTYGNIRTTLGLAPLADGDIIAVASTGGVYAPTENILSSNIAIDVDILISGDLTVNGISVSGESSLRISAGGTLTVKDPTVSIYLQGANAVIDNAGVISGTVYGPNVGLNGVIYNSGIITAQHAIYIAGQGSVVNSGLVQGTVTGIDLFQARSYVVNTGTVYGVAAGIQLQSDNVDRAEYATNSIQNSGTISSQSSGIANDDGAEQTLITITNSGLIEGLTNAILCTGNSTDTVENSGTMKGAISLGGGNDTYHGHGGRVLGNIDMQGGADVIDLRGGTVSGTVAGGNGADTYYVDRGGIALVESFNDTDLVYAEVSFRLADRIENLTLLDSGNYNGTGNSLDNLLNGNSGDNRLTGFSGNDTANGDLGNDRLLGGTGNDSLTGDDGEDTVIGHAGADSVRGGEGDDSLNGGAGKDLYVGNDGADTFAFTTLAHTANTQATCDVISDFITGDDLISVLSLDANKTNATPNDTFTWVGTSAFVNGTAGVLRYVQSGGNTYVEMELTGDALSDGMIKLTGLITLSASDFVL